MIDLEILMTPFATWGVIFRLIALVVIMTAIAGGFWLIWIFSKIDDE